VVGAGRSTKHNISWKEARPDEKIIGNVTDSMVFNKLLALVGEIIQGGLNEYGENYLDDKGGEFWMNICNLDKSYIKKKYNRLSKNSNRNLKSKGRR